MSGLGIAWAGWAEHLGIVGDLVGNGMQVETAVGAGMLVCAVGVRWMVGRWERAKRRWWRDWERVGEGLERDLKVRRRVLLPGLTVISFEGYVGSDCACSGDGHPDYGERRA